MRQVINTLKDITILSVLNKEILCFIINLLTLNLAVVLQQVQIKHIQIYQGIIILKDVFVFIYFYRLCLSTGLLLYSLKN